MSKQGYVYILASDYNGTLYVGATSNLIKRVYEHKTGGTKGFTKKYKTQTLVYYEIFEDYQEVFARERTIKAWKREWKINLIEKENPRWEELYDALL